MPLYAYECACGKRKDEFRKVKDRNRGPKCECGGRMKKLIGGHNVAPDMQPYFDDNLQTYIKGKQHRRAVMAEQGVSEKIGRGWY